jgi:hypothetical protein
MSNVVEFRARAEPRPSQLEPAAALADLAVQAAQICQMPARNKHEIQQLVFLLDLTNANVRRLVQQMDDEAGKAALLNHSALIGELIEVARHHAAAL